ncbi:hypothetical protein ACHAXA_007379 [Cyclostephanos tholiformis]|uniref:Uncharacterized protein n=1 Tax=Cyclostephanos tholiformis TaxID=382380 RepID=A0ABD3RRK8_9STRA
MLQHKMAAKHRLTHILLIANLILLICLLSTTLKSAVLSSEMLLNADASSVVPPPMDVNHSDVVAAAARIAPAAPGIGSTNSNGFYFVHPREGERDFYEVGKSHQTDKVAAPDSFGGCIRNDASCTRPNCTRPECRPWGHHYDTIYQQRLGPYSRDDVMPFQFLEIGFFQGGGYDTSFFQGENAIRSKYLVSNKVGSHFV